MRRRRALPPLVKHDDEAQAIFQALVQQWKKETCFMSSMTRRIEHPAYQAIIRMGEQAISPIMRALEEKPDHFGPALYAITGARPVPKEDAGKVDRIAAAWLQWARENGYRW